MKLIHTFLNICLVCCCITATLASCSKDDDHKQDYNPLIDDPKPEEPTKPDQPVPSSSYNEQYRPQIHFTPAKNWMNDPNGMVYADGNYHLFYQYNPQGNDWGNMSWGHATSTDLMHWTEQPVALTRDELGDIFSGSAVIDKNNTAGFGANAMVALYTSAGSDGKQQQSIAFSTDGGKNFTRYTGNPVIKNDDDNLRDLKVFWHEASKQWIMALAKGWKMGVEFYASPDLKSWQHQSTFFVPLAGRPSLQWECPDLIQMGNKWVLLVSVNPGGPILGSGMMYFVGQFDGKEFKADGAEGTTPVEPQWLDYGMDNYAGVTWSNTGDRHIMIGWMNNWSYAGAVPCSPWRSAMTLPRELKLIEHDGKYLLCAPVVSEIDKIAGTWTTRHSVSPDGEAIDAKNAYQLRLTLNLDKNTTVAISNDHDEQFTFDVDATTRSLTAHRTSATGKSFGTFSIPSLRAPLNVTGTSVTIDLFVDQSSVELLTGDGTMSMTNLVFPASIYNHLKVVGAGCEVQYRPLNRIWQ